MKAMHQTLLADLHEQIKHIKDKIKDPALLAEAAVHIIDAVIIKINQSYYFIITFRYDFDGWLHVFDGLIHVFSVWLHLFNGSIHVFDG